jgi:branched-chain amino acid transport system permease protein
MKDSKSTRKAPKSPYLKTSYAKDLVIEAFDTPFRKICMLVGLFILIVFPFCVSNYFIHIANLIAIASIGALALNLLCGNAGLLSLGHAGFMASGAFTTAILSARFKMPIWLVIPAAGVIGAAFGFIGGLPSLRLKGMYLGLSTLAIHYVIIYIFSEYQYYGGFGFGITIKDPKIGPFTLSDGRAWYFLLCLLVWVVALFIKNLLRSRPGRAWIAIHNRDIAAEVIGIHIGYYKVLAFVVSTSITAMAGSIYAYYTNVATIDEYSFSLTISYLAMIILGGMGSILGSILGAFLITSLPFLLMYAIDYLQISGMIKDYFFAVQTGLFGAVIIFFLLVEPLGLAEIWRRVRTYFQLWPFRFKPLQVTRK